MNKIKFGEVKIGEIARKLINECLDTNSVTCGNKVKLLEEQWAKLFNTKYCTAVNSGSSACLAAFLSLYKFGAKRGDKVIIPGLSFIATGSSLVMSGLTPLYCDISKNTLVIDENKIEDLIKKNNNIRAICPVTLMGRTYNAKIIREICDKYNLILITDNCEGAGCKYEGKFIESYSDISLMSLYAAHLVFSVQGGLVSTNREDINDAILSIRSHGRKPNSLYFEHNLLGSNFQPTDLHCCIGIEQIQDFWNTFNIRKKNWQTIRSGLDKYSDIFHFCDEENGCSNSPHAFSITFKSNKYNIRDLALYLEEKGIETKRNFGAIYTHKAMNGLGLNENCPNAEWIGNNGIHFGCHRYMDNDDCEHIIKSIENFLK